MTFTEHQIITSSQPYGRPYTSLDEALRAHRIPVDNHGIIRKMLAAIDVAGYYGTTGYIKAVRADGGPDIHIQYGWSDGFRSDELQVATAYGAEVAKWRGGGVIHPEHKFHDAGESSRKRDLNGSICSSCFMMLSVNGACSCA